MAQLQGKSAIITGANQGLGKAIAIGFAQAGANIALCARNEALLQAVAAEIAPTLQSGQKMTVMTVDVSSVDAVHDFVDIAMREIGPIEILVNNAGTYGPIGPIETLDWAEWVRAIEINMLGSIIMCRALLPYLKERRRGKIIQLSGGGATNPMPNFTAYAVSKVAVVRFAESLAEEVRNFGIDVNSIAPGALNTRLLDDVLAAGPERVGAAQYARALSQKENGGAPLDAGVKLALFLASPASDGITGRLISAIWDRWEDWPDNLDALKATDAYTLRRIVGRDRSLTWGDK
ncbi:SDR family oxidoreductase [Aquabacter sp. CN5-332]|uniref:SDR family NAD(P)-dependent oxidoreductase n=1 Tax=Aquabacter sp. CN5-332 TaxID=3156608 RepID=UPI0032B4022C